MTPIQAIIIARKSSEILEGLAQFPAQSLFLCSTRDALATCEEKGLNAVLLSENMLNGRQGEINDWAYPLAIDLVARFKQGGERERVFFEANFYEIKALFVQALKFVLIIGSLTKKYSPSVVYLPGSSDSFFTETCREYFLRFNPSLKVVEFRAEASLPTAPSLTWMKCARQAAAFISNLQAHLMIWLDPNRCRMPLWVTGALNHLGTVVSQVATAKVLKPIFIEDEFDFEKYLFCTKRAIPFVILPKHAKTYNPIEPKSVFFESREVVFDGVDYTGLFGVLLHFVFSTGILSLPMGYTSLQDFFNWQRPAGILLDEDLSPKRRSLAAIAWAHGIPTFVLSHGVPMPPMKHDLNRTKFCASSTTIVNSDLEKEGYQHLHFNPSNLLPLGTPRYDEVFNRLSVKGTPIPNTKKNILLCLSGFYNCAFEELLSFVGSSDTLKDSNQAYLKDILEVLKERGDVFLRIKPHYKEEAATAAYVRTLNPNRSFCIESHRTNIFELEDNADIIVTPESTVISEAIMFKKPVIIMNYTGLDLALPYERCGFATQARNKHELSKAIFEILDRDEVATYASRQSDEALLFFAGRLDGQSTKRVADHIHSSLLPDIRKSACLSK